MCIFWFWSSSVFVRNQRVSQFAMVGDAILGLITMERVLGLLVFFQSGITVRYVMLDHCIEEVLGIRPFDKTFYKNRSM